MASIASVHQRSGRSVVAVNGVLAAALIAVIAAVALVVNPPAPPGIAEFAPQAAKPITKAPLSQSSHNGSGAEACLAAVCASPSPSPSAHASAAPAPIRQIIAGVPSGLECFTWPDGSVTQTFDPQSPPCVASWPAQSKGNGGATSAGVSPTAIRVAYPQYEKTTSLADMQRIVDFFNTHFELYGRQIQLVPFESHQLEDTVATGSADNPADQHADAAAIGALHVFAATAFDDDLPNTYVLPEYLDSLAQHKVIAVVGGEAAPFTSAQTLQSDSPYAWSYYPTVDATIEATAMMVCKQLTGKDATHSGSYKKTLRSFALLMPDQTSTGGSLPGLSQAVSELRACGVNAPVAYYDAAYSGSSGDLDQELVHFRSEGITSILTIPWGFSTTKGTPGVEATRLGYKPEWIEVGVDSWSSGGVSADPGDQQARYTLGLGSFNKFLPVTQMPWEEAYAAVGGNYQNDPLLRTASPFYHEILMLASGIQAAGADLTPASFSAGLSSLDFPNPGAGRAPTYQARVGFAGHVMTDDYTEFWLSPEGNTATLLAAGGTQNNDVFFCYVDLGKRVTPSSMGSADGFFSPACR